MEPIRIPIEDVLDLHTFRPQDIAGLLEDYFDECIKAGIQSVRVIHGKGKGVLRRIVHSCLEKVSYVKDFRLGGHGSGSWGATQVDLFPKDSEKK